MGYKLKLYLEYIQCLQHGSPDGRTEGHSFVNRLTKCVAFVDVTNK